MRHAGRGVIRLNDPTDHGGRVISTSSGTVVMGAEAALADDMTFCPRCKGIFAIIPDGVGAKHAGKSYAYHGDVTACGARLITTLSPSGAFKTAESSQCDHAVDTATTDAFNDCYVLRDEDSGETLAMIEYAIERENGSVEYGMTDKHGKTHLLSDISSSEKIHLYVQHLVHLDNVPVIDCASSS